jgi:hypothetical protein
MVGNFLPLAGFAQSGSSVVSINTGATSDDANELTGAAPSGTLSEAGQPADAGQPGSPQKTSNTSVASKIGVQVKISTLGIGGEVGIQVLRKANVRVGFNDYSYSHTFDKDGISYAGKLTLRSMTANFDWYLLGPLHISPGALLYNGFHGSATASVPGGKTFTLGNQTYQSSTTTPLIGNLALNVPKAAPELLIGLGNLVPRSGRHFTMNFDVGVAFQGSLTSSLALSGLACLPPNSSGPTCVNAGTDPTVQANVKSQQTKLNNDLKAFKYYPVISFGIGYKF